MYWAASGEALVYVLAPADVADGIVEIGQVLDSVAGACLDAGQSAALGAEGVVRDEAVAERLLGQVVIGILGIGRPVDRRGRGRNHAVVLCFTPLG